MSEPEPTRPDSAQTEPTESTSVEPEATDEGSSTDAEAPASEDTELDEQSDTDQVEDVDGSAPSSGSDGSDEELLDEWDEVDFSEPKRELPGDTEAGVDDDQGASDTEAGVDVCAEPNLCVDCVDECSTGAETDCTNGEYRSCQTNDAGCWVWSAPRVCDWNKGLGEACQSDTQCANAQCVDGVCCSSACDGTCQRCGDGGTCNVLTSGMDPGTCDGVSSCGSGGVCAVTACTRHADCPESACHLSGLRRGTCFESGDVVNVSTAQQLLNAITGTPTDGRRVIRLATGEYTLGDIIYLNEGREFAFIGGPGVVIKRSSAPYPLFSVASSAYFSGMTFQDIPNSDISAIGGSTLWVDSCRFSGSDSSVSGALAEVHVRNSLLGSLFITAGSVHAENSVFVSPGELFAPLTIRATTFVDLRYITVRTSSRVFVCDEPGGFGTVRNSILYAHQSAGGPLFDTWGCPDVSFDATNATTDPNHGTQFSPLGSFFTADSRLTLFGATVIGKIAQWQTGDPLTDIDGKARPQNEPGYPGISEF